MNKIKGIFLLVVISLVAFASKAQYSVYGQNPAKYKLKNGLTVIIEPKNQNNDIAIDFTYRFGSAVSYTNQTPIANLIGQNLFSQIKNSNGYTLKEFTELTGGKYFQTVKKDFIKQKVYVTPNLADNILWYMANNLAQFTTNMNQEGLNTYKKAYMAACQNKQNLKNDFALSRALYHSNNPYSWNPTGSLDQLEDINVYDIKEFYADWFGVNNAVLTIAGSVDTTFIHNVIEHFSTLPSSKYDQGEYDRLMTASMVDGKIPPIDKILLHRTESSQNTLYIAYTAAQEYTEDVKVLDFFEHLLNIKKSENPLYAKLINTKLASNYEVKNNAMRFAGEFIIKVEFDTATKAAKIRANVLEALQQILESDANPKTKLFVQSYLQQYINNELLKDVDKLNSNYMLSCVYSRGEVFEENPMAYSKHQYLLMGSGVDFVLEKVKKYQFNKPFRSLLFLSKYNPIVPEFEELSLEELPKLKEHSEEKENQVVVTTKEPSFKNMKASTIKIKPEVLKNKLTFVKTDINEIAKLLIKIEVNDYATSYENYLVANGMAYLINGSFEFLVKNKQDFGDLFDNLDIEVSNNKNIIWVNAKLKESNPDVMALYEFMYQFLINEQKRLFIPHTYLEKLYNGEMDSYIGEKNTFLGLAYDHRKLEILKSNPMMMEENENPYFYKVYEYLMNTLMNDINTIYTPENTTVYFDGKVDTSLVSQFKVGLASWGKPVADRPALTEEDRQENAKVKSEGIYFFDEKKANKVKIIAGFNHLNLKNSKDFIYADFLNYCLYAKTNSYATDQRCKHSIGNYKFDMSYFSKSSSLYNIFQANENIAQILTLYYQNLESIKADKLAKKEFAMFRTYFLNYYLSKIYLSEHDIAASNAKEIEKLIKAIKPGKLKKFANAKLKEKNTYVLVIGDRKNVFKKLKETEFANLIEVNDLGQKE